MKTWNDYKEYVKNNDPEIKKDVEEIEDISAMMSIVISQRKALGFSQRALATMCDIPQSSVARMETLKTIPTLSTFVKILRNLNLKLNISSSKLA